MYRHSKKNIQKKFVINKKIVIFVLLFWMSSFFVNTWAILIMSVFCLGNALLMSIDRYISLPIDMELSNFSTILMSIHFGLGFGLGIIVLGVILFVIAFILGLGIMGNLI